MQLTLYHYWRSSCSWRVRWALALKNVAYTPVAVNILKGEHKLAAYRAINPSAQLPTLVIDGRGFSESLAIIDWLDETHPSPPLYPADPLDKLYVKQLALKIVAGTQPLQNPSLMQYFVPVESERKQHMQHFITQGLTAFEQLLSQGKPGIFSFGDAITVADLCLIPQVYNAIRFDVDLKNLPLVRRIYEHCLKTEACDQAAPHRFAPSN